MPRVVDAEARRQDLVEAVWRVIRREGLPHASVRKVATEAGLSMGSLRHYFTTQDELLQFSLRAVGERVTERLRQLEYPADARGVLELVALELLPLDPDRFAEVEVWVAFTAATLTNPALRALGDESYAAVHDLLRDLLRDLLGDRPELEAQADRLHALIDGLALHGVSSPGRLKPDKARAALREHLDALTA
ncbi:TetR/AcrR family transcriptional regulator [Kribbella deserti]|uniref:TetR/AcrR family transcriptional regulator n=1 Tax=Kribbella deserti TaxID=1926257 RepID=A0ABV6QEU8_9ACTN